MDMFLKDEPDTKSSIRIRHVRPNPTNSTVPAELELWLCGIRQRMLASARLALKKAKYSGDITNILPVTAWGLKISKARWETAFSDKKRRICG